MAGMVVKQFLSYSVWWHVLVGSWGISFIALEWLISWDYSFYVDVMLFSFTLCMPCAPEPVPFLGCALYVLRRLFLLRCMACTLDTVSFIRCVCRVLARLFFTACVPCVQKTQKTVSLNKSCANEAVSFMLCRHVVCSWDFLKSCAWLVPMRLFLFCCVQNIHCSFLFVLRYNVYSRHSSFNSCVRRMLVSCDTRLFLLSVVYAMHSWYC
jgi:hypothetical protein